jgi:hypothetical protein
MKMDFENLISMIMDSEYTPKIIQMIMTTGLNLLDKYLTKKIENQPKKQLQPIQRKNKKKKRKKKK